jgi:hypothetical protein
MSDKVSGYQIRTDLLHLASKILEAQTHAELKLFDAKLQLAKSLEDLTALTPPKTSVDEILTLADKLNGFVQTKQ